MSKVITEVVASDHAGASAASPADGAAGAHPATGAGPAGGSGADGTVPATGDRPAGGAGAAGAHPAAGAGPGGAASDHDPVEQWRLAVAETAAADRGAAEAGVRLAYRQAGLAEPERIVWVGSPLGALVLLSGAEGAERRGRSVREQVRDRAWAAERARLHGELGPLGWAARWGATGGRLWEVTQLLSSRIAAGVVEAYATATAPAPRPANGPWPSATDTPPTDGSGADGSPTSGSPTSAPPADGSAISAPPTSGSGAGRRRSAARVLLLDAVHGQQDAAWLSAFDAGPGSPLEGIAAVARAAGWWWPYERLAVLCDRPAELHRDEAGRLDRSDGPALAFRDGFALCSWRGMPVPGEFLAELATLTPERIRTEENAELRRVMLEHYGYDRYLAESGAVPQHRDETGVLWRIAMTGDEDTVMVEVLNSTPEPDGTTRTYWLRVPPTTRTAREGVAWTFGLSPEEYVPMRQT